MKTFHPCTQNISATQALELLKKLALSLFYNFRREIENKKVIVIKISSENITARVK